MDGTGDDTRALKCEGWSCWMSTLMAEKLAGNNGEVAQPAGRRSAKVERVHEQRILKPKLASVGCVCTMTHVQ